MEEFSFLKLPQVLELIQIVRSEIQRAQRPAEQVILSDEDVMNMLKISKRKLQYMLSDRILSFHRIPGSPRRYYLLSDLLSILEKNRVKSISPKF